MKRSPAFFGICAGILVMAQSLPSNKPAPFSLAKWETPILLDTFPGGVIWDTHEIYDSFWKGEPAKPKWLNDTFQLNYQDFCTVRDNQLTYPICLPISFANALALTEVLDLGVLPQKDSLRHYSGKFLFAMAHGDCQKGVGPARLIKALQDHGICPFKEYNWTSCNAPMPAEKARASAQKLIPIPVQSIWKSTLKDWRGKKDAAIFYLRLKKPPVVCFMAKPPAETEKKWTPFPIKEGEPGHAMAVVGYKHQKGNPDAGEFILMNTRGPNANDGGFVRISYHDFGMYAEQAFVMGDVNRSKGGGMSCNSFSWSGFHGGMQLLRKGYHDRKFASVPLQLDRDHSSYEPGSQNYRVGWDTFQLTYDIPVGNCAYLIGVSPENQVSLLGKSEWSPSDTATVQPRLKFSTFQLREGANTFVLLQSLYPIRDIEERMGILKKYDGPVRSRLERAFGCHLIQSEESGFDLYEGSFRPKNSSGGGMAVPLILQLRAYY